MKKERVIGLILMLTVTSILSYLIFQDSVRQKLQIFWQVHYFNIIYLALVIGIILVFLIPRMINIRKYARYMYFIIFLPIAVFPLIRCYFKLPYTFCHICPNRCPWGHLVKATVPMFIAMNLDCRFWCYNLCPLGTLQDYQSYVCHARVKIPKWLSYVRYVVLAGLILAIILVFNGSRSRWLFNGDYIIGAFVFFALIIFGLAFCIPRPWCKYICPIGTIGDLGMKRRKCKILIDEHKKKFKQKSCELTKK